LRPADHRRSIRVMSTSQSLAGLFLTDDLPFAAYLHASRRLLYISSKRNDANRVEFVFADPDNLGESLNFEFETGAECSAVQFYDTIRRLPRIMDRTRSMEHTSEQPARRL